MPLFLAPVLPIKVVILAALGMFSSPKEVTIGYLTSIPGKPSEVRECVVKNPEAIAALLKALEIEDVALVPGSPAKGEFPSGGFVRFGGSRPLEFEPDDLAEVVTNGQGVTILVLLRPGFVKEVNRVVSKHVGRPIDVLGNNKSDM